MARNEKDAEEGARRLERSPIHLLHRAGQCAAEIFQQEMGEDGLTPRQYAILATVAVYEGLSQTDLVARTGIDRSTLADVVRRMLKKGLLQRRRTREDARAYSVKLTEAGVQTLKASEEGVRRVEEKLLAALPSSQRERFVEELIAIVAGLGAMPSMSDGTQGKV